MGVEDDCFSSLPAAEPSGYCYASHALPHPHHHDLSPRNVRNPTNTTTSQSRNDHHGAFFEQEDTIHNNSGHRCYRPQAGAGAAAIGGGGGEGGYKGQPGDSAEGEHAHDHPSWRHPAPSTHLVAHTARGSHRHHHEYGGCRLPEMVSYGGTALPVGGASGLGEYAWVPPCPAPGSAYSGVVTDLATGKPQEEQI